MKKTLAKMLICFLVFLVLFNFTLASDAYVAPIQGSMGSDSDTSFAEDTFNTIYNLLTNLLGAFVGLATWEIRVGAFATCAAAQVIISGIVSLGGVTSDGLLVTPFTIFFNEVPLLDVNFMDFSVSDTIKTFRVQVATWYYILRMVATAILLLILIYIGIRMAISTVAQDKALYQKMLTDWACSLALLYLLHYFILFIINLNSVFVNMLSNIGDAGENKLNFSNYIATLALQSVSVASGFSGIVSTIIYALIVYQTLKFLFIYLKRMITIGFLIIISPLITITYSIDKIGDQKAQALNTWMKEFCYNILIQPFHCILYLVFVDVAISLIDPSSLNNMFNVVSFIPGLDTISAVANAVVDTASSSNTMAAGILAIICIKFVDKGEEIIRKIFGFEKASSLDSAVMAAGAISTLANKAGNIGKTLSKTSAKTGNMFKSTASRVTKDFSKKTQKITDRLNNVKGRAQERAANDPNGGAWSQLTDKQKQGYLQGVRDDDKAEKQANREKRAEARAATMEKISNSRPVGFMKQMKENVSKRKSNEPDVEGKAIEMANSEGRDWDAISDSEKQRFMNRAQNAIDNKPTLGKAASTVKNTAKRTISNARTSISDHLHDKNYMSTVIGITAGLAMYGMSKDGALQSILTGIGVKGVANEYLSHTKGQIGSDITETIQATEKVSEKEFNSKEEVKNHLEAVKYAGDSGAYRSENASDEVKNILSTLQKFMNEQEARLTVNHMQQAMNNPNFNVDNYLDGVFDRLKENETDTDKREALDNVEVRSSAKESSKDYLKFVSEARTYSGLKTAEGIGISTDTIADITSKNMQLPDTAPAPTPAPAPATSRVTVTNRVTNEEVTITSTEELGTSLDELQSQVDEMKNNVRTATEQTISNIEATLADIESKTSEFSTPDTEIKMKYIQDTINDLRNSQGGGSNQP